MPGLRAFLLAALVVSGLSAPPAHAEQIIRTAGDTTATLSWSKAADGSLGAKDPRLKVQRTGRVVFDRSIADVCQGCFLFEDDPEQRDKSFLEIADLAGDGTAEVLVDTFSGGAHCCLTTRVYGVPAQGAFRRVASWQWGNAGYRVRDADGDGRPELVGTSDRFAYAYGSSYAGSWFVPLVVQGTAENELVDVTKRFPDLLRADAARVLKVIRSVRRPRSPAAVELGSKLASYVLDQVLLGKASVGFAEVRRARKRKLAPPGLEAKIRSDLRRNGYLASK